MSGLSTLSSIASMTSMSATSTSTPSSTSSTATATSTPGPSGPTSSPLLFFVALGFGVVFTNLWIIVGVKYCFRYNQRNRARALGEDGNPIDLVGMPRNSRRRREKKLMSMDEVNESFPLIKYKAWRIQRAEQGLPPEGGVTATAPPSRAASIKDVEATVEPVLETPATESGGSVEVANTLELAQADHAQQHDTISRAHTPAIVSSDENEKSPSPVVHEAPREEGVEDEADLDIDDDDPIRGPAAPEMLAIPGDTCAICIDNLDDDDDVRGLTCGHAFHAACVDPWLTSRRACCPLCKADYYTPKPRADNELPILGVLPPPGLTYPGGPGAPRSGGFRVLGGQRLYISGPNRPTTSWRDRVMRLRGGNRNNTPQRETEPTSAEPTPSQLEAGTASDGPGETGTAAEAAR